MKKGLFLISVTFVAMAFQNCGSEVEFDNMNAQKIDTGVGLNTQIIDNIEPASVDAPEEIVEEEPSNNNCSMVNNNILRNGSFENLTNDDDYLSGRSWSVLDDILDADGAVAWYTEEGAGIEVQETRVVKNATHGNYVVELDSHGPGSNTKMSQDVVLTPDTYILSFDYAARTNRANDNDIEVLVNNERVALMSNTNKNWQNESIEILITGADTYTISFRAVGIENTYGGILDNVSLKRKSADNCVASN